MASTDNADNFAFPFDGTVVVLLFRLTVVVVLLASTAASDFEDDAETQPTATTMARAGKTTRDFFICNGDTFILFNYTLAGTPAVPSSPNHLSPHASRSFKMGINSSPHSVR